jgi:hypothetical protein
MNISYTKTDQSIMAFVMVCNGRPEVALKATTGNTTIRVGNVWKIS